MVEDFSIAAVILISGWCLFVRRHTWKCKLRRALTISVVLIAVGVVLTSPMLADLDTHFLVVSIGVQHFGDYLGHVCFIAALCTIAYALLIRTTPDRTAKRLMRWRVEYPAAVAATVMLVLLTVSPQLHRVEPLSDEFFQVDCGPYLHAYWTVYVAILIYLMGYMIRLLRALRRDPRSRQTADFYLIAAGLGIVGALAEYLDTWFHFIDDVLWLLLTAPAVMASIAAAMSWHRQRVLVGGRAESHEDTPPNTPKITT